MADYAKCLGPTRNNGAYDGQKGGKGALKNTIE